MKKTRFIALFITAAMITTSAVSFPAYAQETATSSSSVGNTTGEWENKLGDPIYAEILNNADENEKFMTIIRIPDMADHEAIEKEAQSITGINEENYDTISESEYNEELAKWSSEDEELLKNASNPEDMKKSIIDGRVRENKANRFARIVNQLTADVYTEENAKILAKLGVAEEDIVDYGTDLPEPILMLTKSEIERIAEFDDVKCIDLDIFHDVPQIEEVVEWEDKLGDPIYAEILNNADENEKFMTIVGITDMVDNAAIEQEAIRITGIDIEEFDTISESDYNALCSMQRQLAEEFYLNENSKILSKLAVADEDVVTIDMHSASLTLNLTKSEIERIAAYNDVKTINLDIPKEYMPVYEDTSPYNKKIDRDSLVPLLEKAEEGEKFTVWVWVVDRAKDEAICAQVRSRMIADGSWENHTNPEYDNWDDTSKMISDSRRLQDEVYKQENPKIAAALELADEDIIEIGTQAPLFTLDLTKSEIERIAENAYVTHIDYIDLDAVDEVQETLDEAKRDISETTVFLNDVEDTSKHEGLEITEIAMTYTGSPVTLNIVVKDGNKTLEENVDYTAEYSNNIETGTAYLDIIGIGGYKGKRSYHFAIMKADMFGKQGDADGDGEITSNDALILLRGSIDNKKFSESEMALCDMDKDGIITSNDALLVLRKSVGYSD